MNRRTFLGGLGLVGSAGVVAAGRSLASTPLEVVVWFSEGAATYEGLRPIVAGYLGRALEGAGVEASVVFGDRPIPLEREQGAHLLSVEWPERVLGGTLGLGSIDETGDVTLLITDGDPASRPAGYGMTAVGALTGARLLAEMPPPATTPTVVAPTGPAVIAQLLLHECGHALGLTHGHGTVAVEGDAVVATPMIGRYAWASTGVREHQVGRSEDRCGSSYPATGGRSRRLQLHYGSCSRRAIRARYGRDPVRSGPGGRLGPATVDPTRGPPPPWPAVPDRS